MINSNKILTVSYGTFSCTLEGFDDSFETMKAIAEYFRDLTSDDRYFGAEPPQLDAEMMARIAQRRISSPIQVYENESGIVLRVNDPTDEVAPETVVPTPSKDDTQAEAPQAEAPPTVTVKDTAATDIPAETKIETTIETTAVSPSKTAKPGIEETTETAAPTRAQAIIPPKKQTAAHTDISSPDMALGEPEHVAPVAAEAATKSPAADSIAAKLQRIRAVVSRNEATARRRDSVQEDGPANTFLGRPIVALDEFEDDNLDAIQDSSKTVSTAPVIDLPASPSDTVVAQDIPDVTLPKEGAAKEGATDDLGGDEHGTEALNDTFGGSRGSDLESEVDDLFREDDAEEKTDKVLGQNLDKDADDDLENLLNDLRSKTPKPPIPRHARVIKIKRKDFEAALASGKLETVDEDKTEQSDDQTALSDEDEADLLQDLAAVEADTNQTSATVSEPHDDHPTGKTDTWDDTEDFSYDDDASDDTRHSNAEDSTEDSDRTEPRSDLLKAAAGEDEEDVSRLMATADDKMKEPGTSSRLEAYSHLRAAVAVANAEHAAGGTVSERTDDDVYRQDLASVVVPPRRPGRPVKNKSAPLKLVAEQRVDDQAEYPPRGPVRPRRVSAVQVEDLDENDNADTGGFAQFAKDMDVSGLPDLLEAAAAYMSFVEGRKQFSRPQLMTKVRQIDTSDFNREDGLRSFGKLLRDGKIHKTSGGRFTASSDIGFHPDERAAG